jgi:putative ABC transport system substrate-binding protein
LGAEGNGPRVSRRRLVQGASALGLGLLAGCGPWRGQRMSRRQIPLIAYLGNEVRFRWFREGLNELGFVEGRNVTIETRWARGGTQAQYAAVVDELLRLQPAVIVTTTTPPTRAAKQATSTIPIVFIAVSDPVGADLVASLNRPGGNVTGQSDYFAGLSGKRLELLKAAIPRISRVGVLWNSTNPAAALEWVGVQHSGRAVGLELRSGTVESRDDLPGALATLVEEGAEALIVLSDALLAVSNTPQLPELVAQTRLPTMYYSRDGVEAGLLMSYGPSFEQLYRRAAYYVDRVLKDTSPADLPVERPRDFDFVVNLRTARELGLTMPQAVLAQATDVIE